MAATAALSKRLSEFPEFPVLVASLASLASVAEVIFRSLARRSFRSPKSLARVLLSSVDASRLQSSESSLGTLGERPRSLVRGFG